MASTPKTDTQRALQRGLRNVRPLHVVVVTANPWHLDDGRKDADSRCRWEALVGAEYGHRSLACGHAQLRADCGNRGVGRLEEPLPRRHLAVSVGAVDAPGAVDVARNRFHDFVRRVPGHRGEYDSRVWAVDDANQLPRSTVSVLPAPRWYRYSTPRIPAVRLGGLLKSSVADPDLDSISRAHGFAVSFVEQDDIHGAFYALISALPLLFSGCRLRYGEFNGTAAAGSCLLALVSIRARFEHLAVRAASPWDALLVYCRRAFLRERKLLYNHLRHWLVYEADLARIVRARHDLAHRAHPVEDPYLLSLLLELTAAVVELRCYAASGPLRSRQ